MWTTFDGDQCVIFPMFVCTAKACDQCEWLSSSWECNSSIVGRRVEWNTSPYHRWDIYGLHLRGSHCDMPWDVHLEWQLHQRHSLRHLSQSQRFVGDGVRRAPMLSIRDVSNPQMLSIEEVINLSDRILILDYDFGKGSIINIEFPCPIFILHQHSWASTRSRACLNDSLLD